MRSTAPALIYEEGDLIKRSCATSTTPTSSRSWSRARRASRPPANSCAAGAAPADTVEPLQGADPPSTATRWRPSSTPCTRRSCSWPGGYIVINPTEALVAIDQPGRSTKERNIGRRRSDQHRGGRGNRPPGPPARPRRSDRHRLHRHGENATSARSSTRSGRDANRPRPHPDRPHLGVRPAGNVAPATAPSCSSIRRNRPHCAGTGRVRSLESAALHALRAIEEEGVRRRPARSPSACRPTSRSISQPEAPHPVGDREALRLHRADRGRRGDARRRRRDRARAPSAATSSSAPPRSRRARA